MSRAKLIQRTDSTPQLIVKALEEEIRYLKDEISKLKNGNKERSLIHQENGSTLTPDNHHDVQTELERVKAENEVIRAENIRFRVLFESLQTKLNAFFV